jgi:hypothetical protein
VARVPKYPSPNIAAGDGPSDGFPEKLAKYVPAEVLAFYVPIVAIAGVKDDKQTLFVVTAVAALGVVIYLGTAARQVVADRRPPIWFYALAVVAFLGWAIGTIPQLGPELGLSTVLSSVVLPIVIFAVPGIDYFLTRE